MTDRELLEFAAKAADIHYAKWNEVYGYMMVHLGGQTCEWNPLTDDGDALRLAVKLEIATDRTGNVCSAFATTEGHFEEQAQDFGGDYNAATRRAIVRAAAAIGESMP